MINSTHTIAAIATPAGEGGVGIIRVSGPHAHALARAVFDIQGFKDKTFKFEEKRLFYGHVIEPSDGSVIDDGFIVFMSGPHTYTGEDVVELQLHGGVLVLKRALGALLSSGARMAEAGEFTRRAFLSGRIDLTRAEAVMDIIKAGTDEGLRSARGRLDGVIEKKASEIKERLITLVSSIEVGLDFSADISGEVHAAVAPEELLAIEGLVNGLLATYREGAALRDGVRVLILGRPNVGKSSLLNRLLGEARAIVTHLPGTTRDVIEEAVNINGIAIRLMDTAGLRETPDFIESLGVKEARKRIRGADVILFVLDASAGDLKEDKDLLRGVEGKKVLIAANKSDLTDKNHEASVRREFPQSPLVFISAAEGSGIKALEAELYVLITGHAPGKGFSSSEGSGAFIATLRQFEALKRVFAGIERAKKSVADKLPADLIAADLHEALLGLKELTGEVTTEDVLDSIFSKFCIGK